MRNHQVQHPVDIVGASRAAPPPASDVGAANKRYPLVWDFRGKNYAADLSLSVMVEHHAGLVRPWGPIVFPLKG